MVYKNLNTKITINIIVRYGTIYNSSFTKCSLLSSIRSKICKFNIKLIIKNEITKICIPICFIEFSLNLILLTAKDIVMNIPIFLRFE